MAYENLTDQHWAAARLAIHGAFQEGVGVKPSRLGEIKEIFKFLDYHLGLQGAGEAHGSSIRFALGGILSKSRGSRLDPLVIKCIKKFNCASPSFVKGVRSILRPTNHITLRGRAVGLIALIFDQWFNSSEPVMEPDEMPEFCEHLAVFAIDDVTHTPHVQRRGVAILFGILRSPEWREHIPTRFWSMLAYCAMADEEQESFKWCLRNALELLEFTRGLVGGEGLKWWYGTLWFHYDKLETTVREEVERIARDMSLGDGLSDLNLYHNLIEQEVARTRQQVAELRNEDRLDRLGIGLRARLIALEGNYNRLGRITGRRR